MTKYFKYLQNFSSVCFRTRFVLSKQCLYKYQGLRLNKVIFRDNWIFFLQIFINIWNIFFRDMQITEIAEFIVHCSVCYMVLTLIFGELTVLASIMSILFSFLITGNFYSFYFFKFWPSKCSIFRRRILSRKRLRLQPASDAYGHL